MANLDSLSGVVLRNAAGTAYLGAKASYWSDAGVSVPLATYSNASLASANTQPVVSDGTTGAFGPIYLKAARYWRTVTTSAGVSLPEYNLGPIDATSNFMSLAAAPSPTYPFLRYANTSDGHTYRRNAADSAWIDEGLTDSLLNAATVTDQLTGTSVALSATPDSVAALWQRGTTITPSAGTLSLPSTGGGVFNVAAGNFSNISAAQGGRTIRCIFNGASVITHGVTNLPLPGAANITTVAGDVADFTNEGAPDVSSTNWRMTNWQPTGTTQTPNPNYAAVKADMESATSVLRWVVPAVQQNHPGHPKAWANFVPRGTNGACTINASYNVTSVTRSASGIYDVVFTTNMSSANYCVTAQCQSSANLNLMYNSRTLATNGFTLSQLSASASTASDAGDAIHFMACGDQ